MAPRGRPTTVQGSARPTSSTTKKAILRSIQRTAPHFFHECIRKIPRFHRTKYQGLTGSVSEQLQFLISVCIELSLFVCVISWRSFVSGYHLQWLFPVVRLATVGAIGFSSITSLVLICCWVMWSHIPWSQLLYALNIPGVHLVRFVSHSSHLFFTGGTAGEPEEVAQQWVNGSG